MIMAAHMDKWEVFLGANLCNPLGGSPRSQSETEATAVSGAMQGVEATAHKPRAMVLMEELKTYPLS